MRDCDRMSRDISASDGSVARLGGDEFTLLLSVMSSVEDVAKVARRILEALARPFSLAGHEVFVTASIGASVYPFDGDDVDVLLKNADTAMYHAKDEGKNTYEFYTQSMNARSLEQLSMINRLRSAITRQELSLVFQPLVELSSGKIVSVEALLRWTNDELGSVPPDQFIPLAEETGLIMEIGEWVLQAACEKAVAWQRKGLPPVLMGVNLSGVQFRRDQLLETVKRVLDNTGLEPCWLNLELTESVVMQNAENSERLLYELKQLGVSLAIDDFGTGYSSLSYLKRFPIDKLKIDRSFVKDLVEQQDDATIIATIIAMGHSLRLRVVAEGVESEQQLGFLQAHTCDEVQGFLFARPMEGEQLEGLLAADQPFGGDSSPVRVVAS